MPTESSEDKGARVTNQEELRGTVVAFRFRESNGFGIARMRVADAGDVVVLGPFGSIAEGTAISAVGQYVDHPKYGRQFQAKAINAFDPAADVAGSNPDLSAEGVRRYLATGVVRSVGSKSAERLAEVLADSDAPLESQSAAEVAAAANVTSARATSVIEHFTQVPESKTLAWLMGLGLGPKTARKVFDHYGKKTVELITTNPYCLCDDIRGIGFTMADGYARRLGIAADSPFRIRAGVLYAIQEACGNDGHLFLPKSECVGVVTKILGLDRKNADAVQVAIAELVAAQRLEEERDAIYLPEFLQAEKSSARHVASMLATDIELVSDEAVIAAIQQTEQSLKITLAEQQRAALRQVNKHKVVIVTGGPGTGKTTVTRAILRLLEEAGVRVALLSPTGKAARRLSEATGRTASTIHRALARYRARPGHDTEVLPVGAVIVDEMSMVDQELFTLLLRSVPLGARLVLVGDSDQLPSVGPGNVLRELLESTLVPTVRLREPFRQAETSGIILNAHRFNRGQDPLVRPDFRFEEIEAPAEVARRVVDLVEEHGAQVLTAMRKGDTGVLALNQLIQERINPAQPGRGELARYGRGGKGGEIFRVADRVICLRNDYTKGVFNGEIGTITTASSKGIDVAFEDETGPRTIKYLPEELGSLTLAYALTIHRSQGSEFETVIVPVTTQHYIMLARNLVYTAVTRARQRVMLVGTRRALRIALRNAKVAQRHTRLAWRLVQQYQQLAPDSPIRAVP